MTEASSSEAAIKVPDHGPPEWLNACMVGFLKTPGLQRVIGKSVALLGFDGRKTGRRYVIPVSYAREGDRVTVLTKSSRAWWRNLTGGVPVEVRLAGETHSGVADARVGCPDDELAIAAFLSRRPMDAKAYGVRLDSDLAADLSDVRSLVHHLVVVDVSLTAAG